MVHLTNYCMQRTSANLGKYEDGNTLSFAQLEEYLDLRARTTKCNGKPEHATTTEDLGEDATLSEGSVGRDGDALACGAQPAAERGVFRRIVWPQIESATTEVFRAAFRHGDALGSATAPSVKVILFYLPLHFVRILLTI